MMGHPYWGIGIAQRACPRQSPVTGTVLFLFPITYHSLLIIAPRARSAFNTTSKELADIPIAAIHGVT